MTRIDKRHRQEWQESYIPKALIDLNLVSVNDPDTIAEWYFAYLPRSARLNNGRIRDGYLRAYKNPMDNGGWFCLGRDAEDLDAEPDYVCFKPNVARVGKDGKPIKYDFPKNYKHHPILARVDYGSAFLIFSKHGIDPSELLAKYEPYMTLDEIDLTAECQWFWKEVLENKRIKITITEGAKKALSLLGQGVCAIAVPSITLWNKEKGSKELHPWLRLFAQNRQFYIAFDQDTKRTSKRAVNRQSWQLGNALKNAGASSVKRLSWDNKGKGIDDAIYQAYQNGGDRIVKKFINNIYLYARNYKSFREIDKLPGKIKKVNAKYLKPEHITENPKILVLKSPKGTNKTGVLSHFIASDRFKGIPNICVSYLQRLAIELSDRLDIPYRTQKGRSRERNAIGYSLCLDSLSPLNSVPFKADEWDDSGITLDEFTQVLWHLAFGNTTIKKYRKLVEAELGKMLANCWKYNKPIRLADADADRISIELIYSLIQKYSDDDISMEELENNTLTIENTYKPQKGDLFFYEESSPKQIRVDLTKLMMEQKTLLVLTSSQKAQSPDSSINLEKLANQYYKKEEILRIDSETIKNPNHPAYNISGAELVKLIQQKVYKIIIASPTICTGISIDGVDGYFDAVFSFQSGNLSTNSVRQQLARLRDFKVPRYVWCRKMGLNWLSTSRSSNPVRLLDEEKKEFKLNLKGFRDNNRAIELNVCPLTTFFAKKAARNNADNYCYRDIMMESLKDEGYNLTIIRPEENPATIFAGEVRKVIKEESHQEHIQSIVEAEDITSKQYREIEKQGTHTDEELLQTEKFKVKQIYGVEVSKDLVEAHQTYNLFKTLRLYFWLFVGNEHLEDHNRAKIEEDMRNNNGELFIPDVNKKSYVAKVETLQILDRQFGIFSILNSPQLTWSNKSKKLIELQDFVFRCLPHINQILKCRISTQDSPITVLQKILKCMGYKLIQLENKRDGDRRLRIYGQVQSCFSRTVQLQQKEIMNNWLRWVTQSKQINSNSNPEEIIAS